MWHKQSFTQFWSQSDAYSRRSSLKLTYIHHPLVVCTHQICCAVAVPIALSQDRLLHGHNRLVNWTPCSRMRESKLIKVGIFVSIYQLDMVWPEQICSQISQCFMISYFSYRIQLWFMAMIITHYCLFNFSKLRSYFVHVKQVYDKPIVCLHIQEGVLALIVRFMGPTWGPPGADKDMYLLAHCSYWNFADQHLTFRRTYKICAIGNDICVTGSKELQSWIHLCCCIPWTIPDVGWGLDMRGPYSI